MPKIIAIIIFAFLIRFYGINWDQGFHLHPDERMLIMVTERINFFAKLNPQFFNYGSLPIYLLKAVSQPFGLTNYQEMLYTGRYLSIFFDLLTIFLIYKISRILFKKDKVALFSSFFYAVAFFPIQNSHFYTVDVALTSLITLFIYLSLKYLTMPSLIRPLQRWYYPIIFGGVFGAMLATKFTAIIFWPLIISLIILKSLKQRGKIIINLLIFNFSFLIFSFIFMPYAFADYKKYLNDVLLQIKMNNNPYIFPYTLQYVGTLPYLYYLKNIFLWGLGPIISILASTGIIYTIKFLIFNPDLIGVNFQFSKKFQILFLAFYLFYFLIIGRSSVKFMRYMLPIYPFLAIMAGYGLYKLYELYKLLTATLVLVTIFWTFAFIGIYSQPHTRIAATVWINKNIPAGSTLAIEHWDDRLPLYGSENYRFVELTLYDQPDNNFKWNLLNQKLKQSDYIIIASNRLYVPLQKLSDCSKDKLCYPKTAKYYKNLFNGSLGFKKVAEFAVYPSLEIRNLKFEVKDESADESFTVYDHPKIMIFKRLATRTF